MARRAIKVRKARVTRIKKSEQALINSKYLGDEPILSNPTNLQISQALNWYNYMCDTAEAKQYVVDYLTSLKRVKDAKRFNKVADNVIPTTAAWLARMSSNGTTLDQRSVDFIHNRIETALQTVAAVKKVAKQTVGAPKPTIQQNIREKAGQLIAELDDALDNGQDVNVYDMLTSNSVSTVIANKLVEYYQPIADELKAAASGSDPELAEGYDHLSRKTMKGYVTAYAAVVSDLNKYVVGSKKVRQVRKKKTVSVTKKVSNVAVMKQDAKLKVVSDDPSKILGASEVWLFNTTFDRLVVYRAIDRAGLTIKGSSIGNFSDQSDAKRVGRNKEEILAKIGRGTKSSNKRLFNQINTKPQRDALTGRLGKSTLIVKVIK